MEQSMTNKLLGNYFGGVWLFAYIPALYHREKVLGCICLQFVDI